MKVLLLAAVASLALAAPAKLEYQKLAAGKYRLKIAGMVCTSCAKAMSEELKKLPGIGGAEADFGREEIVLAVKLEKSVKVSALRRALSRAERRVNIGSRYELRSIEFLP